MLRPLTRFEPYRLSLVNAFNNIKHIEALNGKSVLVTGSTGMVGSCIIDMLVQAVDNGYDITIYAAARSREKFDKLFSPYNETVRFIEYDASKPFECSFSFDYVIHCAANATPVQFAHNPVETLVDSINGLKAILDQSVKSNTKRFLYVSSGEYYGDPDQDMSDFTENYSGYVNCSDPRSCYPIGKRACEVLCQSYIAEYGADVVIARPCHIFGPTMTPADNRAASQFMRNAANNEDIVLKSEGLVERSQCYVVDACAALLFILINGSCGEAYNISDPRYQMTIRDLAQTAAEASGQRVIIDIPSSDEKKGFSKRSRAVLSSDKLQSIGFEFSQPERNAVAETIGALKFVSTLQC